MVKTVTITARATQRTPVSFRLHTGRKEDDVPRTLTTENHDGTWTMPEWLARKVGFVTDTTFEQLVRENEGRN